jgi:subtilisin family serine protease
MKPRSPSRSAPGKHLPDAELMTDPDAALRKLQPKLRMVSNASTKVSVLRAERSSCVAVKNDRLIKEFGTAEDAPATPQLWRQLPKSVKRGKQTKVPNNVYVNVFIQTSETADLRSRPQPFPGETARRGNLVSATIPLSKLESIATRPSVTHIELGEPLLLPTPVTSGDAVPAPDPASRRFGIPQQHQGGKDVLIGIVDVQGFDFAHEDFVDPKTGATRFVAIWDQGGKYRKGNRAIDTFGYGSEITQAQMNAAIKAAPKQGLPAYELQPQSEMAEGSHGTHVASIAAGNRGVCPRAEIAAVLIALPEGDFERRKSFYDSTRLVHAVEYLLAVADRLGKPISINISLGTNGHAHDASSALNRWIDAALAVPGRCIAVAAGNAGQEAPEFEGDRGFVMGRIHTSGRIASRELYSDIEWLVVGNGVVDVSENELEIWYGAQDRFVVSVQTPAGKWIGPVSPREYIENVQLPDGSILSIYNELYHPSNGCNCIAVYLSPFYAKEGDVGIAAGTWRVRLEGREVRDGQYHGWIERDDPRRVGRVGSQELWSFPSFFSERSNVDRSSVSSLACAMHVVSVANLDEARELIHVSSSQGPTRDGRCKPDVAAPGTGVVAARGFSPEKPWVAMTGTSMASPHVTGLVGLMFAIEPTLTAAQVNGIIQRTSRPLPGGGFAWAHDAGFGRLREDASLSEAAAANERKDLLPRGQSPAGAPARPRTRRAAGSRGRRIR